MRLVTWNVQWCLGVDSRVDPERIVREAREFADFDVLCLQEVACNFPALEGSAGEDQFARLAAALPRYVAIPGVAVDTAAPDGSRRLFGNMILSRLPVHQVARVRLPWPVDAAVRSMPRMLLEATVETPSGLVRVMTTHLEYYSATQRAAQVEALRAQHAEACAQAFATRFVDASNGPFHSQPEAVSAILCGDFNCKASDPAYARMTAAFDDDRVPAFDDAWKRLHPSHDQPATAGVYDREQWKESYACDFVFTSTDLRERLRSIAVDARSQASDHQAMAIELG
jgi:endonuclease/exonuclease/phosphatase family metal-dependent hydrolase